MMNDDVAEMRAELRQREQRIEALEVELARHRPAPPPPATKDGPYRPPSRPQIERLTSIALARFPCLLRPKDREINAKFYASVGLGMAYLGTVHRLPEGQVDKGYYERWCDRARDWIALNGLGAQIDPQSFHVAIGAAGDVDYLDPSLVGYGGSVCFGLTDGGGRAPRNAWLTVLETGRVREPVAPQRPPQPLSPTTVTLVRDWRAELRGA
jgi:hypothetical protein